MLICDMRCTHVGRACSNLRSRWSTQKQRPFLHLFELLELLEPTVRLQGCAGLVIGGVGNLTIPHPILGVGECSPIGSPLRIIHFCVGLFNEYPACGMQSTSVAHPKPNHRSLPLEPTKHDQDHVLRSGRLNHAASRCHGLGILPKPL